MSTPIIEDRKKSSGSEQSSPLFDPILAAEEHLELQTVKVLLLRGSWSIMAFETAESTLKKQKFVVGIYRYYSIIKYIGFWRDTVVNLVILTIMVIVIKITLK